MRVKEVLKDDMYIIINNKIFYFTVSDVKDIEEPDFDRELWVHCLLNLKVMHKNNNIYEISTEYDNTTKKVFIWEFEEFEVDIIE